MTLEHTDVETKTELMCVCTCVCDYDLSNHHVVLKNSASNVVINDHFNGSGRVIGFWVIWLPMLA